MLGSAVWRRSDGNLTSVRAELWRLEEVLPVMGDGAKSGNEALADDTVGLAEIWDREGAAVPIRGAVSLPSMGFWKLRSYKLWDGFKIRGQTDGRWGKKGSDEWRVLG